MKTLLALWLLTGCYGMYDGLRESADPYYYYKEKHPGTDVCGYPLVPDYRNGLPNALVCPDNSPCFQCDHATAKRYEKLYSEGKWDGAIVFLPIGKEP